ncbi:MAG: sensor histidine kinase [bacterium]|nr:MAG: sensor histidine kinase [bacterium]
MENNESLLKQLNVSFRQVIDASNRLEKSYNDLKIHADNLSKQLTLNKGFLDQLLSSLTNAVIDFDQSGNIRRMNHSALQLFSIKEPKNINANLLLKQLPDMDDILKSSMPVLKRKISFSVKGEEKTALMSYFPTRYETQTGGTLIFDDVSELETANRKIKHQEQLAAIGQMASQLAHQLRNPLGSIELFNSLLLDDLTGDLGDIAVNIGTAVLHMNQILTNLLNFAGDTDLFIESCDLSVLITEILNEYKLNMKKKKIVIKKRLFHKEVKTDKLLLKEALANILLNAIDVSEHSTIFVNMLKNPLTIEIADQGRGISDNAAGKIFDPFFTTKHQGTGLGLAIVKKYTNLIGVAIKFKTSSSGTTFYFRWQS